jgi:hypothetical protein
VKSVKSAKSADLDSRFMTRCRGSLQPSAPSFRCPLAVPDTPPFRYRQVARW